MSEPDKYSDEFLSAFVDGQLAAEEKERVYLELSRDEALGRRVCELRGMRELVRAAYENPPLPSRLRRAPAIGRRAAGAAAALVLALSLALGWLLQTPAVSQQPPDQTAPAVGSAADAPPAAGVTGAPVRVVIHVSDSGRAHVAQALDEIEGLLKFYRAHHQNARVEVVINGDGLGMVRADAAPFPERIRRLQREYGNLVFAACQNTIDRLRRDRGIAARLLPGVVVIDSGVAQITRRQHQGWAYIQV